MKKYYRLLALIAAVLMLLCACKPAANGGESSQGSGNTEIHDYAAEVKLTEGSSATAKQKVTVKTYIDGDTTHFNVPASVSPTGVLKARYLAINTPESTGKIEEYGKAASKYTKEKLMSASSIIVESDDANWNLDSTGGRYLVWVWYRTSEDAEYRNLNIELLQNGLAIASSSANNRYGSICMSAIAQAKTQKLNIYSGKRDPDFYYGDAIELTLKELRCNTEKYNGSKVAFEGVITKNNNSGVYIESYDSETDRYYGIYVYYGYGLTGEGLDVLTVGNLSRIVGSVQYYEAGGTYQVSGLTYRMMKPDDPSNIKKIESGHEGAYREISAAELAGGAVMVEGEDGEAREYTLASLLMDTTVTVRGLTVTSIYTTEAEGSSQQGAMTLTCTAQDGTKITVRTVVLYDAEGRLIGESAYADKMIDVRGIVDLYDGKYQVRVFSADDITIVK